MISNKNLLLLLALILTACNPNKEPNYIQFINQQIGTTVSTIKSANGDLQSDPVPGQTIIGVSAPFGMTQWTPQLQSGQQKCVAPYYFGSIYTEGFRATHWLNGACEKDYGSFAILPTTLAEEFKFLPNRRQNLTLYTFEDLSPAYMSVGFPNEQMVTEITATERCGFFRFSWILPSDPVIMISINNDYDQGYIEINLEEQEISGYNPVSQFYRNKGESAGIAGYFVAKFNQEFVKYGTYGNFDIEHGSTKRSDQRQIGAYVSFQPQNDLPVLLKVGTSFTSIENARKNLETEIKDWDFSRTRIRMEQVWNELLGKIEVESKDTIELTKFYTSLYRSFLHPRLMNDVNGDYPVFGKNSEIKNTNGFNYYDDFSSWNISRAQMPFLSLIAPEQYHDMVQSLLLKAKDGGWLPESPLTNNYTMAGTGDFCSSIIVDAAIKGFEFDYDLAYGYLQKNAFVIPTDSEIQNGQGRPGLESYIQNGFIPLDEQLLDAPQAESQAARTLEYAYNDWCVAQLAGKLGRKQDFENLSLRALNYTNVFDESIGWMNGRYTDGSFFEEFGLDQNQS
ncbi:MAG: GH92 family glycosyl hydrolase, partial [Candidatus Marinimicrobia bacterium]|nr:GH92 family glycosyl hydrolase [Candidatus Neomarinimicrobiota bacterium]